MEKKMNPTVEIEEKDLLPVTEDVTIDAECDEEGETADDGK